MRTIFLDELPHKGKFIDWEKSVGYKVNFVYDKIQGKIEILEYIKNKNPKLKIKYNNKIDTIYTNHFKTCNLGKILENDLIEYKFIINQKIKDDKRDITIIDRKIVKKIKENRKDGGYDKIKYYKYKCNKCGFDCGQHYSIRDKCYKNEYWIRENSILNGVGCACCSNYIVVKGINDITTTHPEMTKYFVNIEDTYTHTPTSGDKVFIKCPDCGAEKYLTISLLYNYGFSCPRCGDGISYPEKVMFNLLEQLNIDFIKEYSKANSKWCNNYRYDFYFKLNNEEYIIEVHGSQHYNYYSVFKQSLEHIQKNDLDKYSLAINNGIKPQNYIVIDCRKSELDFIKNNIINSKLNDIFDLSSVDWIKIGRDSEKSLVKEVCNYWKIYRNINNKNISSITLSKLFKLNSTTIVKYLKTGTKLGWCNYDSKEEQLRGGKKIFN